MSAQHIAPNGKRNRPPIPLTEKEAAVLSCIARGMTNKEISQMLNMSMQSVTTRLKGVFRKLHVHNRTEAAMLVHTGRAVSGNGRAHS